MNLSTRSFLLITLLLFGTTFLSAQQGSGQIKGTITDATSGETMIGANVTLKGTSLGSPSDAYGKYIINAIPSGSYTMKVSYIGYRTKETTVEVGGGSTLEMNFSLLSEAVEGEEVIVTAQARGQNQAINQQLSSNTIMNVVSSDKIRELPDQSAAAAISRLPGISLMNGDQIVVRGIQAKNNIILVNGVQLPSTDLNTRSVGLGFISSNMLSSIEVIKSITPDMDANTIGGVVNLRLMEAPKDFHFDVLTQGNYNSQDHTTDNYKFWASASDRFLDDKLGVFIQANADRADAGNDQTSAGYGLFAGEQSYGLGSYQMNNFTFTDQANIVTNAGGSVILDYILPQGKIILQNTLAHTVKDNNAYRYLMDFTTNSLTYTLNRDKYNQELLINALQTEYNFGTVKTEFTLSHSYSDKSTDIRYGDAGDNFGFQNQTERHPFGVDSNGNAIAYDNKRQTLTPEDVYNIQIDPTDSKNAAISNWATTRGEAFKQHLYNTTLDFTIPVSFTEDFSSKFKVGGKFSRSTRSNDLEENYKRVGDDDFYFAVADFIPGKVLDPQHPLLLSDIQNNNYTRGQYFLNNTYPIKYVIDQAQMDRFLPQSITSWVIARHFVNSTRYDFSGAEIFSAGYLMGNFSIGSRLTILGGARFEHYNMDYKANFVYVTHSVDGQGIAYDTLNTVNRNDDNVLPNVQLRYKFTDWADLRLAYTNSLSRPDFQAIMPNVFYDQGTGEAGNSKLKPTLSKNYDASLSFYNNEIGLFTIGGFYKNLDNVFFQTIIYYQNLSHYSVSFPDSAAWNSLGIHPPGPSDQITTYVNNPHPAHIKGLEVEWQTNFWYLPKPFNALVLNINYTRVWSDMDYQQVRNIDSSYQSGRFILHKYITVDTVRNARLLYQGDNILNVALGVDYKGFSGRVSFNLQGNVITTVGSRPELDQFTRNIYKWDLTLQQKLPIEGLSIAFNVENLTHSPTYTYQKFSRSPGGPIVDNLATTIYGPTNFELNLRYSL
jgi:Outer membrane receptor proteins, mostly Fe transport